MKRKNQPSEQLELLKYADCIEEVIQATDSDPDYERFKTVFAQLSKELETTTNAESLTQPSI